MNDLFRLSGNLHDEPFVSGGGAPSLYQKQDLEVNHIRELLAQAKMVLDQFSKNTLVEGVLISLHYRDVVPKSRRVQSFFKDTAGCDSNQYIVGAKIDSFEGHHKHVMTYYVPKRILKAFIMDGYAILGELYNVKIITNDDLARLSESGASRFRHTRVKQTRVVRFFADCSNVEKIDVPTPNLEGKEHQLVTTFDVQQSISVLLKKLNIPFYPSDIWDERSVMLGKAEYEMLIREAGYLVAMSGIRDRENLLFDSAANVSADSTHKIPDPMTEPVVGVIDTSFDETVYFAPWVKVNDDFLVVKPPSIEDKSHGTEVCSIIVDGPTLNPQLDDHCGRFQVRLFPVASSGNNSWIYIADCIRKIVKGNTDIHVWNLSLGSQLEVDDNFISPLGSLLDQLQSEDPNLLFVVAGTNIPKGKEGCEMKVGSPADSINSLVVNSVDDSGEPASYSRKGPILSFFRKPDVAYYGGDSPFGINVMVSGSYERKASGTSLAAPWIARKACFMMEVLGFSREETKALLINSALSFETSPDRLDYKGYGVVPIAIEDVVESPRDEIRFVLKGQCKSYYTSTYDLPVPSLSDGFPFKARLVLVSTLECDRNKGVDYTSEELAASFGRMQDGKIRTINNDVQDESGFFSDEETARRLFRKWDNVKVIQQFVTKRRVAAKRYDDAGLWGLRVGCKMRNDAVKHKRQARFAVVVALKEIFGQDRSTEFERLCLSRGWLVERINVLNKVDLYNVASSDIEWK